MGGPERFISADECARVHDSLNKQLEMLSKSMDDGFNKTNESIGVLFGKVESIGAQVSGLAQEDAYQRGRYNGKKNSSVTRRDVSFIEFRKRFLVLGAILAFITIVTNLLLRMLL